VTRQHLFAVLVTAALTTSTVMLWMLRDRVERLEQARQLAGSVITAREMREAWPEGYELVQLGGLSTQDYMAEAKRRVRESKP